MATAIGNRRDFYYPTTRAHANHLARIRFFLGLSTIAGLASLGCSMPSNSCSARPWECTASSTGGAQSTGSCENYVPPSVDALAVIPKLPDPFLSPTGLRITKKDEWPCRRAEIMAQAQKYELGPNPGAPSSVTGSFDGNNGISVTVTDGANSISFTAKVTYPTTGAAPYPAMIGIGSISIGEAQLNDMGVATIVFPNDVIAQQSDGSSRGRGAFFDLYPSSTNTGAMMAWSWGVGRLIDALEQLPDAKIDPNRLGVTGCSRNGKGALIVGAFEDRIVLTIPQESGSGGSASWRISDATNDPPDNTVQTLSQITTENVWFTPSFSQFGSSATLLPFDHHMIEGLVAPRALLVIENTSQVWLGKVSTYNDSMAAHMIWEALGIPDQMGFSQKGAHAHCEWNGSQQAEVTAYVQRFLIGETNDDTDTDAGADAGTRSNTPNASILKTDGSYKFDKATWVSWSASPLQ